MIPEAAVEAAARAFHHDWDTTPEEWRAVGRERIRRALEAAAPHTLADAWNAGHERGFWNGRLSQLTVPHDTPAPSIGVADAKAANPYGSQS